MFCQAMKPKYPYLFTIKRMLNDYAIRLRLCIGSIANKAQTAKQTTENDGVSIHFFRIFYLENDGLNSDRKYKYMSTVTISLH